ncbi:hypothetical protein STAFG_8541 [Streptomyces afghaniensis 772]|uniref:Uncharacterized protein n=1 Tax=Streptomyces afghaniensis 772 TaxID=1283301 RepID=S4M5C0_9ACTN|nr:hypothetical protein STAFG_8541 [Streptomyces afghaniensis 772]
MTACHISNNHGGHPHLGALPRIERHPHLSRGART